MSIRGAARMIAAVGTATVLATGCAGPRIANGFFHSDKGYRVATPGPDWEPVGETRADLELRHRSEPAGMLVKASCGTVSQRASLGVLARHLLSGLRDRSEVSAEDISMNGKSAHHALFEGRFGADGGPVRVELFVMRDDRCLYDLLYVAPAASFEAQRPAFVRFVETLRTD